MHDEDIGVLRPHGGGDVGEADAVGVGVGVWVGVGVGLGEGVAVGVVLCASVIDGRLKINNPIANTVNKLVLFDIGSRTNDCIFVSGYIKFITMF